MTFTVYPVIHTNSVTPLDLSRAQIRHLRQTRSMFRDQACIYSDCHYTIAYASESTCSGVPGGCANWSNDVNFYYQYNGNSAYNYGAGPSCPSNTYNPYYINVSWCSYGNNGGNPMNFGDDFTVYGYSQSCAEQVRWPVYATGFIAGRQQWTNGFYMDC